ncbi:hypothetical protein D3C77_568790 [compost metagenome]
MQFIESPGRHSFGRQLGAFEQRFNLGGNDVRAMNGQLRYLRGVRMGVSEQMTSFREPRVIAT